MFLFSPSKKALRKEKKENTRACLLLVQREGLGSYGIYFRLQVLLLYTSPNGRNSKIQDTTNFPQFTSPIYARLNVIASYRHLKNEVGQGLHVFSRCA
jgi:hypothetical protein